MVKVLIEGCTTTAACGMTPGEIGAVLATVGVGVFLCMSPYVEKNKELLIAIMFAVPAISALLGLMARSCAEDIDDADKLTKPALEKPSCVKTYSGFTTFQLAFFILAAVVSMWARGNSTNGRFMAFGFIIVSAISWLVGIIFSKDCATTIVAPVPKQEPEK
jgi:hypothetical protein